MPRLTFRDFDEFADSIDGIAGRFVPTARSETDWWLQKVPVGRVSTQLLQIGSAAAFAGDGTPNAITIAIPMSAAKWIRIDGTPLQQNSFLFVKEDQPFTFTGGRAVQWAAITMPLDQDLLQRELLDSLDSQAFGRADAHAETRLAHLTSLKTLLSRMFSVDLMGPIEADAARRAEEEVATVISRALEASSKASSVQIGRPRFSRTRIVARALELIDASAGQPLFVEDLCRAAQVSERTLRRTFEEYFGVGPMRLLKVRQLREIRAALLAADPTRDTVVCIAARFGVWDFSLFARNYKALYNESPSFTLRSAPIRHQRDPLMSLTWIRYACRKFSSCIAASGNDAVATDREESVSSARQSSFSR